MKTKIYLLAITILICFSCKKQQDHQISDEEIKIDSLSTFEQWDIEHFPDGAIMFLDIPYSDPKDTIELLTISVPCKDKEIRPIDITFYVSNNVLSDSGIKLIFANYIDDKIVFNEDETIIPFVDSKEEDIIVRIKNGYITIENETVDILQNFLDYEIVFFNLKYPNGESKSVMLHLFHFQNQYRNLREERSMVSE